MHPDRFRPREMQEHLARPSHQPVGEHVARAKPESTAAAVIDHQRPYTDEVAVPERSSALISPADVPIVFNDDCISYLAELSKLPKVADKSRFGRAIHDSVQIYLRDAAMLNENDIHREIARLHQAARFRRHEKSFELITNLSPQTRAILNRRNLPGVVLLIDSSPLLDPARQRQACEQLATLCRMGAKPKEGRKRPGGKRSKTLAPDLYAPPASRHFEKRAAERTFLMWLRIAWLDATGEKQRARTAARTLDILGPFAKFVCECLNLVGAKHVDGIALINEAKERTFDEACRRMPYGLGSDFQWPVS